MSLNIIDKTVDVRAEYVAGERKHVLSYKVGNGGKTQFIYDTVYLMSESEEDVYICSMNYSDGNITPVISIENRDELPEISAEFNSIIDSIEADTAKGSKAA